MIDGYFNRYDPAKEYESHAFRAGFVLQSAELNEIQANAAERMKRFGDAIFKNGDLIRDARIVVNPDTGETTCESGAIYLSGAVRGVPTATLTIPVIGIVAVGVYLQTTTVTALDDPALRDPASLTRNYMEEGAARIKVHAAWGFSGDSQEGDFFPVYTVENGIVRSKEPPPSLDAVTQALARYDRDSAGGTYVVSGFGVKALADLVTGEQVYSVGEGRARVNGYSVDFATSRRVIYEAVADLKTVTSEPFTSATTSAQRVNLNFAPVSTIASVQITEQKTVTLTHGGYTGVQDLLPDTSVLLIVSVVQGGTTYVQNTDYKLTAGKVDWSLAGAEPATGSTYTVTYQYIHTVTPTLVDSTGFTVTGAVVGSLVLTTYSYKLPRVDRLILNTESQLTWLQGVSADWNPQAPSTPNGTLSLATVYQDWVSASRVVTQDAARVVPMYELSAINGRIDFLLGLITQQRLEGDMTLREAGQKKGVFVDPFLDDALRDAGTVQTAAIFSGELHLPVTLLDVKQMTSDVAVPTSTARTLAPALSQTARTGVMLINPYMAFAPIPAAATIAPAVDQWTEIESVIGSVTERFSIGSGNRSAFSQSTSFRTVSSRAAEVLRPITVNFTLSGFGPNEVLSEVKFDGVVVTATAP